MNEEPSYKITLTSDQIRKVANNLLAAVRKVNDWDAGTDGMANAERTAASSMRTILKWIKEVAEIKENYILQPVIAALAGFDSEEDLLNPQKLQAALSHVELPPKPQATASVTPNPLRMQPS